MTKEEFVSKMMFQKKLNRMKAMKQAKEEENLVRAYRCERRFEAFKGKPDTYKRRMDNQE